MARSRAKGEGDGAEGGAARDDAAPTWSLGAVVKLTGLSEHAIRAWERRYGAVRPRRSPKGTRRFSAEDVARLRLLAAAVEAGERIGDVARLSDAALEERVAASTRSAARTGGEVRRALERLDPPALERILGLQLAALGPAVFARDVAAPLLRDVGDRWERGEASIAEEHLLSTVIRGILAAVLRGAPHPEDAPRLLFTTPEGERHELGLLVAAVTAVGAGAAVTCLGPDLPVDEVVRAARTTGALVVALSIVTLSAGVVHRYLGELRGRLPAGVEIWVGGAAADGGVVGSRGAAVPLSLEDLERRVARLRRHPAP